MSAEQRLEDALRLILEDTDPDAPAEKSKRPTHDLPKEPEPTDDVPAVVPAVYPHDWDRIGHVDYFYRDHTILVRTTDLDSVLAALQRDPAIIPADVGIGSFAVIDGVTGLFWRGASSRDNAASGHAAAARMSKKDHNDRGGDDHGGRGDGDGDDHDHGPGPDPLSTPYVLARLDRRLGVGVARPDHLLSLCPHGHPCPASEPDVVPTRSVGPVPPVNSGICCGTPGWDGRGVLVGVVDGGLIDDARIWPWMAGVAGDRENPIRHTDGLIKTYACHGTFVAGCVRCIAPKADVFVKRAAYHPNRPEAGAAYESEIIREMSELLDMGAEIIVCEFDGITRLHLPLITFEAFYDNRLRQLKDVVVVAPAGNDTTRLPTFPAAYSWVIGVGALSAVGHSRADFSNYGGWVDVYAPGVDLVNAFAVGNYVCNEEPNKGNMRQFRGLAKWSGTSFSAPLVAGMIAARMSATGESAPRAADALLRLARSQAVPGIGPVLRPDQVCATPRQPRQPRHAGCDCGCDPAVPS